MREMNLSRVDTPLTPSAAVCACGLTLNGGAEVDGGWGLLGSFGMGNGCGWAGGACRLGVDAPETVAETGLDTAPLSLPLSLPFVSGSRNLCPNPPKLSLLAALSDFQLSTLEREGDGPWDAEDGNGGRGGPLTSSDTDSKGAPSSTGSVEIGVLPALFDPALTPLIGSSTVLKRPCESRRGDAPTLDVPDGGDDGGDDGAGENARGWRLLELWEILRLNEFSECVSTCNGGGTDDV